MSLAASLYFVLPARVAALAALLMLAGAALAEDMRLEDYSDRPLRGVSVASLAWQAGTWRSGERGDGSWQFVSCPEAGQQLGLQQDARAGKTRFFEFQRFADIDGGVVFLAHPLGREATPFVLVEQKGLRAVFENQHHDFPQRIILRRQDQELIVSIEGERDGETQGSEWRWKLTGTPGRGCD